MKYTFYFTWKALFVFKIFKFWSWLFGHVAKRLDKKDTVKFKFNDVSDWLTNILPNISRSKGNQEVKFGQLIECNMRNISLKNSCINVAEKLVPDSFLKNLNWAYLWINTLKFYTVSFLLYVKLRAIEIYWN